MFASLYGRSGTEKPRLGKILSPPEPEHGVLLNVGTASKEPYIVFRKFPHTPGCFAWGPRMAIGRRRRELRLRRSGLDSRQRYSQSFQRRC